MTIKRFATGLAAALFAMSFVLSSTAFAQSPVRQGLGRGISSLARPGKSTRAIRPDLGRTLERSVGRNVGRNVARTVASQPRGTRPWLSPNRSLASWPHSPSRPGLNPGRGGYDLADAIDSLGRNLGQYPLDNRAYNGYGGYPFGNYGYGGYPYGRDFGYHDHDAYADAFRDAAIANAVVGVVGIIANSAAARAAQPVGHYERRQVVIQPGYYEDVQVWVPEYRDAATGDIVSGHYEVRPRWVPEVYGYQDVWVGPPAAVAAPAPGPAMVTPVPATPGPRPIYFRR